MDTRASTLRTLPGALRLGVSVHEAEATQLPSTFSFNKRRLRARRFSRGVVAAAGYVICPRGCRSQMSLTLKCPGAVSGSASRAQAHNNNLRSAAVVWVLALMGALAGYPAVSRARAPPVLSQVSLAGLLLLARGVVSASSQGCHCVHNALVPGAPTRVRGWRFARLPLFAHTCTR